MKTPIADFVKNYSQSGTVRLHMPGHKGKGVLGAEALDITEINGADVLSEATGIIGESEQNAAQLFGAHKTFYSTEGSSQAIKTMLAVVNVNRKQDRCRVLAARNVHKAFVYGCALCDIDVSWLYPEREEHLCSCKVTPERLKKALTDADDRFDAVYVTSPDYLGNTQDVKGLASVCDEFGVPLLVDNAHGAYLAFMEENRHPIILGASMCCDSAHKTLPVLTGGAYLHIAEKYGAEPKSVRSMMSVFGSTSPSYLILQSLDLCNAYLADGYSEKLKNTAKELEKARQRLADNGFTLYDDEVLKLTVDCAAYGYSGDGISEILRKNGIEIEFSDDRFAVMMFTPENTSEEIGKVCDMLCSVPEKAAIEHKGYTVEELEAALNIRQAVFAAQETVSVNEAVGRICGAPTVSCPPAVPVVISGEIITAEAVKALKYYGINNIDVVK